MIEPIALLAGGTMTERSPIGGLFESMLEELALQDQVPQELIQDGLVLPEPTGDGLVPQTEQGIPKLAEIGAAAEDQTFTFSVASLPIWTDNFPEPLGERSAPNLGQPDPTTHNESQGSLVHSEVASSLPGATMAPAAGVPQPGQSGPERIPPHDSSPSPTMGAAPTANKASHEIASGHSSIEATALNAPANPTPTLSEVGFDQSTTQAEFDLGTPEAERIVVAQPGLSQPSTARLDPQETLPSDLTPKGPHRPSPDVSQAIHSTPAPPKGSDATEIDESTKAVRIEPTTSGRVETPTSPLSGQPVESQVPTAGRLPAPTTLPQPTAMAQRIERWIESLQNTEPPHRITVDLDESGQVRATVAITAGSLKVTVAGLPQAEGMWLNDLSDALKGGGLEAEVSADTSGGSHQEESSDTKNPNPKPRMSRTRSGMVL